MKCATHWYHLTRILPILARVVILESTFIAHQILYVSDENLTNRASNCIGKISSLGCCCLPLFFHRASFQHRDGAVYLCLHRSPADSMHALGLVIWLIFCSFHKGPHLPLSSRSDVLIYHKHFLILKYLWEVSLVNPLCLLRPFPGLLSAMFWKTHTAPPCGQMFPYYVSLIHSFFEYGQ